MAFTVAEFIIKGTDPSFMVVLSSNLLCIHNGKESHILAARFMFLDHSNTWKFHPTNMSECKIGNWTSSEYLTTLGCILKYISFLGAKTIPLNNSVISNCVPFPDVRSFCGARQYPYICKEAEPLVNPEKHTLPSDSPEIVVLFSILSKCTPFPRNALHPVPTLQSSSVSNVSFIIHIILPTVFVFL